MCEACVRTCWLLAPGSVCVCVCCVCVCVCVCVLEGGQVWMRGDGGGKGGMWICGGGGVRS